MPVLGREVAVDVDPVGVLAAAVLITIGIHHRHDDPRRALAVWFAIGECVGERFNEPLRRIDALGFVAVKPAEHHKRRRSVAPRAHVRVDCHSTHRPSDGLNTIRLMRMCVVQGATG